MSEQTAPTTGTENTNEQQQQESVKEFQAITSQEDFDKAIQARLARERAKFADYEDLKAKASKFEELENAQKTEAQKAQEALAEAQKRAADLELKAARAEVAAAKGVPVELLSGSSREEIEAHAEALIAFKGTQPGGPVIPNQGKQPDKAAETTDDWFRALAGGR